MTAARDRLAARLRPFGRARRFGTAAVLLAGLALAACGEGNGDGAATASVAGGGDANPAMAVTHPLGDITLGDPEAPVTLVEYASFTCGHCAAFHTQNLPRLKTDYIDTGKVYYVFREYPLDPVATAASMLTRCIAPDRYLQFADILFQRQAQWAFGPDPRGALETIARQGGVGSAQFEACLTDQALLDGLREGQQYAMEELGIVATPTLFINSDKIDGNLPWTELEALITKHLPAHGESADQDS